MNSSFSAACEVGFSSWLAECSGNEMSVDMLVANDIQHGSYHVQHGRKMRPEHSLYKGLPGKPSSHEEQATLPQSSPESLESSP